MNNFITVKIFTYPHELAVIRGRLEAEGIECFIKDELTIETNPFYSNALGGIKLQVRENEVQRTIDILKDGGYIKEEINTGPSSFNNKIDTITSKIPFIKNLQYEFRLIFTIMFFLVSIIIVIYILMLPSKLERLTSNNWCVDKIIYNGTEFQPKTVSTLRLITSGMCDENIYFDNIFHNVRLPGFNSNEISGLWKYEHNTLQIFPTNNFDFVYTGIYKINFSENNLTLKSNKTIIHCHKQALNF